MIQVLRKFKFSLILSFYSKRNFLSAVIFFVQVKEKQFNFLQAGYIGQS
jgi:hypothetical protein